MSGKLFCIVTTIQPPTASLYRLATRLHGIDARLIVVGDKKSPSSFDLKGAEFLSLADQSRLSFALARELPTGHYARKNLGYLLAMSRGATCIYETDDDNAPDESWSPRSEVAEALQVNGEPWLNIYTFFGDHYIWPRGFPLDLVTQSADRHPQISKEWCEGRAPIQQGLVNVSPDVDAVWRLLLDRPVEFLSGPSVRLLPGTWCPFNSQSTWWWPSAYPLMYLPSYCTFRATDIWRSFIAQRCLWEMGLGVVFHGPEVVQHRNQHNLMRDFADEIPVYIGSAEVVATLKGLRLAKGADQTCGNLLACYEALVGAGFFPEEEMRLVASWVRDATGAPAPTSRT
jgi:hypothetical protein